MSQFLAGDGFSPRAEDAILHGCVPVVVMDEVDPVFSSILDWSAFSLRIAEVAASPKPPPHLLSRWAQLTLFFPFAAHHTVPCVIKWKK